MKLFRMLMILAFTLPGMALASPLTSDEVDRFLDAVEEVNNFDEEYDVDIDFDLEDEDDFMEAIDKIIDEDGNIQIFTSIFREISAHPEAGPELQKAIVKHGFSDEYDFADVGNRLAIALVRSEMTDSDLNDLRGVAQVTPAQIQYLPEEVRPLVKRLAAFVEAIENVPASDVELAEEARPRLEALDN